MLNIVIAIILKLFAEDLIANALRAAFALHSTTLLKRRPNGPKSYVNPITEVMSYGSQGTYTHMQPERLCKHMRSHQRDTHITYNCLELLRSWRTRDSAKLLALSLAWPGLAALCQRDLCLLAVQEVRCVCVRRVR